MTTPDTVKGLVMSLLEAGNLSGVDARLSCVGDRRAR